MRDYLAKKGRKLLHKLPMYRHANAHPIDVDADNLQLIAQIGNWAEIKPFLRISLPIEILTMEGAYSYLPGCNPFVTYYEKGPDAFQTHFDQFQPKTLCEKYSIMPTGLLGEDLPLNTLPWLMTHSGKVSKGEWGLGPEHGISYHGPVTGEKFELEVRRLTLAKQGIEKKGYYPERHGDIQGYFLRRGDEFRFSVRGGKHRAAVLTHLGWDKIPVRMKPGWPRIIDRNSVADWPDVANGRIDKDLALAIFDTYFEKRQLTDLYSQQ